MSICKMFSSLVQRRVSSSIEHICSNVVSMWVERGLMLHVQKECRIGTIGGSDAMCL